MAHLVHAMDRRPWLQLFFMIKSFLRVFIKKYFVFLLTEASRPNKAFMYSMHIETLFAVANCIDKIFFIKHFNLF